MSEHQNYGDADAHKGAVEGDDNSNTSMSGQNPHRTGSSMVKANDTDFPEPGNNPEHSGERQGFTHDRQGRPYQDPGVAQRGSTLNHEQRGARNRNSDVTGLRNSSEEREPGETPAEGADIKARRSPDREQVNQDPGHKQKQMHNQEKDDPLAA